MKRTSTKQLLLALFFLSYLGVSGQVFFLNENFSTGTGTTPPTGWTNNTLVGNAGFDKWAFNNPGGRALNSPISTPAAIFDSDWYSAGGGAEDVTLESPAFNTTGYAGVTLKWDQYFQSGFGGRATVEVWDGTTWQQVYDNSTTSTGNPNGQLLNVTSFLANKTGCKVRFRWRGDYSWYWIVDNVQVYYTADVQTTAIQSPSTSALCGATNDSIIVVIKNNSGFAVTNFPVTVTTSGLFTSSQTRNYPRSLASLASDTMIFPGGNTLSGGSLTVTAKAKLVGDNVPANDSIGVALTIIGTPQPPTVTPASNCGPGSMVLSATPAAGSDSIAWFTSTAPNTSPVATGTSLYTPVLSNTTTYYAAGVRGAAGGGAKSLATITTSGNAQQGVMFDIIPTKNITLDSISMYLTTTYVTVGTYTYSIYYRTGTFLGFQTNSSAWTFGGDYTVTFSSTGYVKYDITDIKMNSGQTYGFYITIKSGPGTAMDYTTLTAFTTYSNSDVAIYAGNGVSGLFAGTFSPRGFNGIIHYNTGSGCLSSLVPVDATVKPVASGVTLSPKSGSKGTFLDGSLVNPDVNANGDLIEYSIVNPTAFTNAEYGASNKWNITSLTVRTTGGYSVPSTMYSLTNPSSIGAGSFGLNTDTTLTDSIIAVTFVVRNVTNGCDTTFTRHIYIAPRPKANFGNSVVCAGTATQFTDATYLQKGGLAYEWSFGAGGATSTLANPTFVYPSFGSYTVKLVVTSDKGYKDSITKTINVKQIPVADFKFENACEGTQVKFTDNSSLPAGSRTFIWNFGDGGVNGSGASTAKLYTNPGVYLVTLLVDVDGCADQITKYVTQMPRVKPDFTFTGLVCDNNEVTFTNGTPDPVFGSASYSWNFGDNTSQTGKDVKHAYSAFQTYNVTLFGRTDLGCTDSVSKTVTLKEAPIAKFGVSGAACNGDEMKFTNNSVLPTGTTIAYTWDFGDVNSSTDANPTHRYAAPGTKKVMLEVSSTNGCKGTKDTTITINLKPTADFAISNSEVCLGGTINFTNNSNISDATALTYNWSLGDGITATTTDASATYASAGAKNVSLITSSANGCHDTAMQTVTVNPLPTANILIASQLGRDGKFTFTTNSAGPRYLWLFGDGARDSVKTTVHQYPVDGAYSVILYVISDKGCLGKDSVNLFVNRLDVQENTLTSQLKLYPNPGTGRFTVDFNGIEATDIKSVTVLNNLGQQVGTIDLSTIQKNTLEVNITEMAAGIYFINVETTKGKTGFKYNLVK